MKNWLKLVVVISILLVAASLSFLIFNSEIIKPSEKINILLLGADARTSSNPGFTDSITILSIDKNTTNVSLLSIPRDTVVEIPGRGEDKINSAYPYTGINNTITTVENFLDIKIDYYILVDFTEFKELVDSLGGITMDVQPHVTAAVPELNGKSGVSRLNGDEALAYLRFRSDSASEGGRIKRHQEAIDAIITEIFKPSNLDNLPTILNQLRQNVKTNIPLTETTLIKKFSTGFSLENATIRVVPGYYTKINGQNCFIPNKEETEKIVVELGLRN